MFTFKGMQTLGCVMTIVGLAACGGYDSHDEEGAIEDTSAMTDHELEEDFLSAQTAASAADGIGRQTHALHNSALTETLFRESVGLAIGGTRCTGVQVSNRYILTAGHCLDSFPAAPGFPFRRDGVVNIAVRYSSATTGTIVSYNGLADFAIHANYMPGAPVVDYDVALIRLRDAPSHAYRGRIYNESSFPGLTHYIAGWSQDNSSAQEKNYGTATLFYASKSTGVALLETNDQHTIPGDSGCPYIVKGISGSTVRYITDGIHSRRGTVFNRSVMKGARPFAFWPWVFTTSLRMGDPLTCRSGSIAGLNYYYSCD